MFMVPLLVIVLYFLYLRLHSYFIIGGQQSRRLLGSPLKLMFNHLNLLLIGHRESLCLPFLSPIKELAHFLVLSEDSSHDDPSDRVLLDKWVSPGPCFKVLAQGVEIYLWLLAVLVLHGDGDKALHVGKESPHGENKGAVASQEFFLDNLVILRLEKSDALMSGFDENAFLSVEL